MAQKKGANLPEKRIWRKWYGLWNKLHRRREGGGGEEEEEEELDLCRNTSDHGKTHKYRDKHQGQTNRHTDYGQTVSYSLSLRRKCESFCLNDMEWIFPHPHFLAIRKPRGWKLSPAQRVPAHSSHI